MSKTSLLSDLLTNIAERGQVLLDSALQRRTIETPEQLLDCCELLLLGHGEASGIALASKVLDRYRELSSLEKRTFFEGLSRRFGVDIDRAEKAVASFREISSQENAAALHFCAEPRRQELIRRLNRAPNGTVSLVAMRADLLASMKPGDTDLRLVDKDFRHLFNSWFNRGFLSLMQIDWRSQANILGKIIEYEAVHEISGWDDLRQRVNAEDRRLYCFFHPALTDEPLIFVEVALTAEIPGAIGSILDLKRKKLAASEASVATFYAISNCQKGLRGLSFGSFLIKQVVEELRKELPQLRTFVTLSPLPKMRDWMESVSRQADDAPEDEELLKEAAAHYLVHAKQEHGEPFDPVARFHLSNGARLDRINTEADLSKKGRAQSYGIMVNYLYDPGEIERNHEAYTIRREIVVAPQIRKLLQKSAFPKQQKTNRDPAGRAWW